MKASLTSTQVCHRLRSEDNRASCVHLLGHVNMIISAVGRGTLSRLLEKVGGECDGETKVHSKREEEQTPKPENALEDKITVLSHFHAGKQYDCAFILLLQFDPLLN